MEMPERVKLNTDKSLTVFLNNDEIILKKEDYVKSDKGKILLKHKTIRMLAEMAKVKIGPPLLISTHSSSVYVIARTAKLGDEELTELGESNEKNLYDVIMQNKSCNDMPQKLILVDDVVDSKWTLTVCGYLLMQAGCEQVIPFALADSSSKE